MSNTLRVVAFATAALTTFGQESARASLIWDGSASRGTGIFKHIGNNCSSPGSISAASDSTYGQVWRYNKPSGLDRCENHGINVGGSGYTFRNGSTYYIGWRSRLSNTTNNNANFQWKVFPAPGPAGLNWPLALKMVDGRATLLNRKATSEVFTIWTAPVSANTWYHYVFAVNLSNTRDGGYVELWLNGVKQTFINGTQRWACRLYDQDHVCPKWGVYGASSSSVINYVHGLRIGTTFADVAPPNVPTPTPTPTATATPTGTPVFTPTPTPTPTPSDTEVDLTPAASGVTASTHDGNVPGNSVDNNLATRWSANGDGQWIRYDLGAPRILASVKIAWYNGTAGRRSTFDVQVADAPTGPWATLLNRSQSSGASAALETYDVADTPARHVRIVGHGNTTNAWNSITEVELWGF